MVFLCLPDLWSLFLTLKGILHEQLLGSINNNQHLEGGRPAKLSPIWIGKIGTSKTGCGIPSVYGLFRLSESYHGCSRHGWSDEILSI